HVDWEVELAPERRRGVAPRLAVRRNRADLEPGSAAGVDVLAPRAQEIPRGVELLDPVIADIGDVDVPRRRIRCDPDGEVELPGEAAVAPGLTVRGDRADLEPGPAAGDDVLPPRAQEVPRRVELLDPLVGAVDDVYGAARAGGDS